MSRRHRKAPSTPRTIDPAPPAPLADAPAISSESVAAPAPAAPARLVGRFHVVRAGESLWSIAERLLGPGASPGEVALKVRRLWRLNEDRIGTGDPNLLRVGVKLRLR